MFGLPLFCEKGVAVMENERKVAPNYEAEFRRACETNEQLKIENVCLVEHCEDLKSKLIESEKEIAFLKGQVKAFEFCVAKGK